MEFALLKAGRGGGGPVAFGGFGTAPLEADRPIVSIGRGTPSESLEAIGGAPPEVDGRLSGFIGTGEGAGGGILVALPVLVGGAEAFGGGGVARTGVALLGSFLLTHFLSSVS